MSPPTGHLSLGAAAERLGMSRTTLMRRVAARLCPARWRRGRCYVPEAALRAVPGPSPTGWRRLSPARIRAAVRRRMASRATRRR